MDQQTVEVIVAELEGLQDDMNEDEMLEFKNCKQLLLNPHYSNREFGKVALLHFSPKFLDPGSLTR